ncbi:MAG: type IV toxin-antitoxin system AbiEi family antitoxin domain-containing protein [Solirubrobacterales bacterium]
MRISPAQQGKGASVRVETAPRIVARERALAALATRQHGTAARRQLLRLGFSSQEIDSRIVAGRLIPIFRGVYAVGHVAVTRNGRWIAATLAAGPASVLSHRDGAALWVIGDFAFGGTIEVTLPGTGSRSIPGIRVHRSRDMDPAHVTAHNGIPVTTVARTLLDLAGSIGSRHLRQAFDVADRREDLDRDELAYLIRNGRGHRGLPRLAALVAVDRKQARRARSILELDFLAFCREQGFPEPLVNHFYEGFEVDACWPGARLVVELDSWEFHHGRDSFERDRAKSADLQAAGLRVIQVTDRRLKTERSKVAATIDTLLAPTDAD